MKFTTKRRWASGLMFIAVYLLGAALLPQTFFWGSIAAFAAWMVGDLITMMEE